MLKSVSESIIENVLFRSTVTEDLKNAVCTAEITTDNRCKKLMCELTLKDRNGKDVYYIAVAVKSEKTEINFKYADPLIWSPSFPTSYTLNVNLLHEGKVCDSYRCDVRFTAAQ